MTDPIAHLDWPAPTPTTPPICHIDGCASRGRLRLGHCTPGLPICLVHAWPYRLSKSLAECSICGACGALNRLATIRPL